VAQTLYGMSLCKEEAGDVEGAVLCLREAQSIYRKRGTLHWVAVDVDAALLRLGVLSGYVKAYPSISNCIQTKEASFVLVPDHIALDSYFDLD